MIYLWRKGESKQFEEVLGELPVIDPSVLDRFKFDYATYHTTIPRLNPKFTGFFRHKSVEASVVMRGSHGNLYYEIRVKFVSVADAKEFMVWLMGGVKSIPLDERPSVAPTQVGKSWRKKFVIVRERVSGWLRRLWRSIWRRGYLICRIIQYRISGWFRGAKRFCWKVREIAHKLISRRNRWNF